MKDKDEYSKFVKKHWGKILVIIGLFGSIFSQVLLKNLTFTFLFLIGIGILFLIDYVTALGDELTKKLEKLNKKIDKLIDTINRRNK